MIRKNYSLANIISLIWYALYTKIRCNQARIIRTPFYLRGKKYINFGSNLTTGVGCRIECMQIIGAKEPILNLGQNVQINDYVHICALNRIEIGDDVLIASHVYISDNSHGSYKGNSHDSNPRIPPIYRAYATAPVKIGNRVWIGEGVIVLPGVTIGDGVIVGAHSIVNKDIPNDTIAVGSPVKIIKKYNISTKQWEKTNADGSFIENK